jgi:hypothetical protein
MGKLKVTNESNLDNTNLSSRNSASEVLETESF